MLDRPAASRSRARRLRVPGVSASAALRIFRPARSAPCANGLRTAGACAGGGGARACGFVGGALAHFRGLVDRGSMGAR